MRTTALVLFIIGYHCQILGCERLVWSDEFNYSGKPDVTKWGYDIGGHGWGNNESQYYTDRIDNAFVENGYLTIRAKKENYSNRSYTSARLVSRNKGDWKYGRFEIRAKLPKGRGTWPAIWMLPTDWKYGGWPNSGEIDIMEHVGYDMNRVHGSIHTQAYNHLKGTQKGAGRWVNDVAGEFHVYSIEWEENSISYFVDGDLYFKFNKESDDYKKWPFDQRFHLLLNIAIGGSWGGVEGIDDNIFPTEMVVDYVRVYQTFDKLSVAGSAVVLENEQNLVYQVENIPDVEFKWYTPNDAKITSGQGTHKINVDWGAANGSITVQAVSVDDCSQLNAQLDISISSSAEYKKLLVDDFEGNSIGTAVQDENVQTTIANGEIHIDAKSGAILIYEFDEPQNIEPVSLLKIAVSPNGKNGVLADVRLQGANGNKTKKGAFKLEANGQFAAVHSAFETAGSTDELNWRKINAILFEFEQDVSELLIDEIAFYGTDSKPIPPGNPRLFDSKGTTELWWEDSPNALNYDILFSPEKDGEYHVLFSNVESAEVPHPISFTEIKKFYRVIAKNAAGESEMSNAIEQASLDISSPVGDYVILVGGHQILIQDAEEIKRVSLYSLDGKFLCGTVNPNKTSSLRLPTRELAGMALLVFETDQGTFNRKINLF